MPPRLSHRLTLAAAVLALAGCAAPVARDERPGEALEAPERYAHSIAAVGFPFAQRAFQIGDGSVAGTGEAGIAWRLPADHGPRRTSPVYFEKDGVPVAHWWVVSARESVHFEAAAMPLEALGDSSLLLAVRASVTWRDAAPGEAALDARIVRRAEGPSFVPWDVAPDGPGVAAWSGTLALRDGRVVAAMDQAATTARVPGPAGDTLVARHRVTLGPGATHVWRFWIPAYPVTPNLAKRVAREATFEHVAPRARAAWRPMLTRGATLATPDSLVNASWRASLVTLLMDHERAGDDTVAIGNPLQYRDLWIRDGAQVVRALAVAGQTALARADAWAMRRFQLPGGALLSQAGQLDGTGQALWAMAQAATTPPDADYARKVLPVAAQGYQWVRTQRAFSRELRLPWAGLLPYAAPRDNELLLGRAQLVGNDAWACAGLRGVEQLARLAGNAGLAAEVAAERDDYRVTFLAALQRTGHPDVPPSWQGIGRDWGNLTTGYPARLLPADDPRLAALARRVWGGAATGFTTYATRDSLHSYAAADLATWALLAGRPADARAVLAGVLANASSTLGHTEIFSRTTGDFGTNLPPHGTAAARLVQLVRDMIVCDVRDTLELALGGDPAWWAGTRLERAPTRFGIVDVALARPAPGRLEARWTAVDAPTRIRVPDGWNATRAVTPQAAVVDEHWVMCPPGVAHAAFDVAPAAEAR